MTYRNYIDTIPDPSAPYLWRNDNPIEVWPGDYAALQSYDPGAWGELLDMEAEGVWDDAADMLAGRLGRVDDRKEVDDGLPF